MRLRGIARLLAVSLLTVIPAPGSAATATIVMQPSTSAAESLPGPYSILENEYCRSAADNTIWGVTSHVAARINSLLPFSGRVYDANWKALAGTRVTLFRLGYEAGDTVAQRVAVRRTNSRGEFTFRVRDPKRTAIYWSEIDAALSAKVNTCTNSDATWDVYTGVSDPVLVYTQPSIASVQGRRRGAKVLVSGKVTALAPKLNGTIVVRQGRRVLARIRTNSRGLFTAPLGIRKPGTYRLTVTYEVDSARGDYYLDTTRRVSLTIPRQTPVHVSVPPAPAVTEPVARPVTGTVRCPFSDRKKCPAGT